MDQYTAILNRLQAEGFKLTKARLAIIELFFNSSSPVSALDIQSALEAQQILVNKTTVYRELTFLVQRAVVREIDFGEGKKRYELSNTKHHHHVICLNCQRIEDVELDINLEHEEQRISVEKNFKIINHSLEFFGLCPNCQQF